MTVLPEIGPPLTVVRGDLRDRTICFSVKLRDVNEAFAARGIVGGAHVDAVFSTSREGLY